MTKEHARAVENMVIFLMVALSFSLIANILFVSRLLHPCP